ncbi:MAG TPA: ACT domain-containing protein [Anaerolineae bacterium]|nr:ACT domain-containing protein [Anaerolineae bacterium]
MKKLELSILPQRFAVCRLDSGEAIPEWLMEHDFWSVTRTHEELSVVLPEASVPASWKSEKGWRCLKVRGPLDFSLTGILASLASPLAEASISIFAISTYDSDYILVRDHDLEEAKKVLSDTGHAIEV